MNFSHKPILDMSSFKECELMPRQSYLGEGSVRESIQSKCT